MEYPIKFDTVKWDGPLYIRLEFHKTFSLKILFVLAYTTDPDEISHYAAFHLGLHCLPKYRFREVSGTQKVNKTEVCLP